MALLNIFRRNPLKSLSRDKLKEMEIKLKVKSEQLTKEVADIEREIQYLFERSKGVKSRLEEISLANRIKTLAQKKEMKVAAHAELERELRAVGNLLVIKEHEADLRAAGVWEPLQKMPPDVLERYLIEMRLDAQDREARIKAVTEMTASVLKPGVEYEEGLEDILKVMQEVREGKLEPEAAKEAVMRERPEE